MASFETNPFTVLSLIAAPAVLTNASSVLALGTSNRFARANDRARQYATELDAEGLSADLAEIRSRQLDRAERRCLHLVRALASFYMAVGSFAAAALVSAIGSGLAAEDILLPSRIALVFGLLVGIVGVGSIVRGCFLLLHETDLAVANLQEESQFVRARRKARVKAEAEEEESSP
jgi:hypothetical protein